MEKIITIQNFRNFAYCNDHICKKPIKGIVLLFFGLGSTTMHHEDSEEFCSYVEKMRAQHKVTYFAVLNRGHCSLPDEVRATYNECILKSIEAHSAQLS